MAEVTATVEKTIVLRVNVDDAELVKDALQEVCLTSPHKIARNQRRKSIIAVIIEALK